MCGGCVSSATRFSVSVLSKEVLRAHARQAVSTVQALLGRGIDPQTASQWAADLPAAQARITREATQVGLVGHLPGDLARGAEALYDAPILRDNADRAAGRLLRIVHTDQEPELEEHTPDGAPWHWSTAHPDPVPPLRAQATGLQAERAALTKEDQNALRDVSSWERKVARLQQDVVNLSSAVGDAQRAVDIAVRHREAEEHRLARSLSTRGAVQDRLPKVLANRPKEGVGALSAAVLAQFHPNTLDELAKEDIAVERARKAVAATRAIWEDADARACDARSRLASHEEKLSDARRSLSHAMQRRNTLRSRADQLSRKRLSLARQMDDAAEARRSTLADDLAARLHGDPRGRLRLRWPKGGPGHTIIALVAPGTHADDPVARRAAEDALSTRADALLVCASIHDTPTPERARVLRRMARACPRVALVFFDVPLADDSRRRRTARQAWATALDVAPEQILAVALPAVTSRSDNHALELARREREALGLAILDGPPVARAAGVARAIRTTASRVDAEIRRQEQAHEQQRILLDAQRIDDPAAFALSRRDDITRALAPATERARATTRTAVDSALQQALAQLEQEVRAAPDRPTFLALRSQLPTRIEGLWSEVEALGIRSADRAEARAIDSLLDVALAPLSERVRLTAQATRPPNSPPPPPDEDTAARDAVLGKLQTALDEGAARSPAPAVLAGGAIGAAVLGPLGAVLGAGAGAWANKVGASLEKRQDEAIRLVRHAFADAHPLLEAGALSRLDGAEMRVATAVDARLIPMLDRFMAWWADQRDDVQRRRMSAAEPIRQLARVRDALVASAVELDHAIAAAASTAGVVVKPAYVASLPPPPPPIV